MGRWKRLIAETHEFLGDGRYNAENHYHLPEPLPEQVLFQNPRAAISSSLRQNLSAKDASKRSSMVVAVGSEKTSRGRKKKKKRLSTQTEKSFEKESRQHRKTADKVRLERLHEFPALINKVWPRFRSAHCSSHTSAAVFWFTDRQALAPIHCFSDGTALKAESGIRLFRG